MNRRITISNDVDRMLERYRLDVINSTGKERPSYSDIIRFILQDK